MTEIFYETLANGTIQAVDLESGEVVKKSPTLETMLLDKTPATANHHPTRKYIYSEVWKDIIIEHFVNSPIPTFESFHKKQGMPGMTLLCRWRSMYPDLEEAIATAKKVRAERAADKIMEQAFADKPIDKESVPGMKLQIDALKWTAKTGNQDEYGEKTTVQGKIEGQIMYVIDTGIKR